MRCNLEVEASSDTYIHWSMRCTDGCASRACLKSQPSALQGCTATVGLRGLYCWAQLEGGNSAMRAVMHPEPPTLDPGF